MNAATLTQFLVDVTRGHLREAFAADADGVLRDSALDEATRTAVREHDIGALWLARAHPMALMYFARQCGWDNDRYYGCIARAEVTRADRASGAPPTGSEPPRTH